MLQLSPAKYSLMSKLKVHRRNLAASLWDCSVIPYQKQPKISVRCVLVKREWERRVKLYITRGRFSIASSRTSCFKVATLPTLMVLVVRMSCHFTVSTSTEPNDICIVSDRRINLWWKICWRKLYSQGIVIYLLILLYFSTSMNISNVCKKISFQTARRSFVP